MNTILHRIFLTCLFTCAGIVITMIWVQPEAPPDYIPQTAVTLFITGLASFLLWFTRLFWSIYTTVTTKEY